MAFSPKTQAPSRSPHPPGAGPKGSAGVSPPQSRAQRSSQLFTDGAWLVHLRSSPNVPARRVTRDFAVSRRLSGSVRIPRSACPFTRRWRAEPRAPTKHIHKDCGVSLTFPDSHRVCVVPARGYVSMSSGGAQPSRGEGDGRPCPPLQPASPAVSPCAETRPPVTIRTRGAHTPPQHRACEDVGGSCFSSYRVLLFGVLL